MIETRNFRILRNVVLTILSLWVAVPLFVVVSTSLKPLKDVSGLFQWIPREITASPYGYLEHGPARQVLPEQPHHHRLRYSLLSDSCRHGCLRHCAAAVQGKACFQPDCPVHPDVPRDPVPPAALLDLHADP